MGNCCGKKNPEEGRKRKGDDGSEVDDSEMVTETEITMDFDPEEGEEAATKIQARYKAKKQRTKYLEDLEEHKEMEESARKIQTVFRGKKVRQEDHLALAERDRRVDFLNIGLTIKVELSEKVVLENISLDQCYNKIVLEEKIGRKDWPEAIKRELTGGRKVEKKKKKSSSSSKSKTSKKK
eukprot:GFYU01002835.1.p1 GENE.GFYU01002835.1~~GFYU01002835.1.p1  ORF type:complete len:181 (+),score=51.81 GFYU01002835.1:79-621(+)